MSETTCDFPGCDLPAHELLANDAPLGSPDYAERCVCRWHKRNAFGEANPVLRYCDRVRSTNPSPAVLAVLDQIEAEENE